MDFRDTPAEASFRKEVSDWLEANLPERAGFHFADERVGLLREWQGRLHDGGWAGLSWPKEYGGRGASLIEQVIFSQEFARVKAPPMLNMIGIGMAGPTIIAHGTEAQKVRHLTKILSGEEIWCQGFSEPEAGSDLAGLRTSAALDGDAFVVNGQKVWTTIGHIADWCILLVRTDSNAPKHQGITYLLLDMHSPGVEVRPLRQITGEAEFNETFFTDVRVPVENVVGQINDGWRVAMTTLLHERGTLGFALATQAEIAVQEVVDLAKRVREGEAIADPLVRQRLAGLWVEVQAMRLSNYRALASVVRTGIPGPEGSLGKLLWSENAKRMFELSVEMQGPAGLLDEGEERYAADGGLWQYRHLRSRGNTIEAGTSEILRNIIAERVLGLPKHK